MPIRTTMTLSVTVSRGTFDLDLDVVHATEATPRGADGSTPGSEWSVEITRVEGPGGPRSVRAFLLGLTEEEARAIDVRAIEAARS